WPPGAEAPGRAVVLGARVAERGKPFVRREEKHVGGGLFVPGAPGSPAVDRDRRALIDPQDHDVRVVRIDPDAMVVVTARRALDRREILASVGRLVGRSVGDINDVAVAGIDLHLGEVGAAAGDATLRVDALPARTGVVGAINATQPPGLDVREHSLRIGRRDADSDAAEALLGSGKPLGERLPCGPSVRRVEEAAARSRVRVAVFPGSLPRRPEDRIDVLRVSGIEREVDGARVLVLVENLLPALAAVGRAEDAALRVRTGGVPEHGDEN